MFEGHPGNLMLAVAKKTGDLAPSIKISGWQMQYEFMDGYKTTHIDMRSMEELPFFSREPGNRKWSIRRLRLYKGQSNNGLQQCWTTNVLWHATVQLEPTQYQSTWLSILYYYSPVPLERGPIKYDIAYGTAMTAKTSQSLHSQSTPILSIFGQIWPRYNGPTLYVCPTQISGELPSTWRSPY